MIRNRLAEQLGLLRSRLMYYGKPFNRRRLTRFYRQFIQSGDLCFDIGAHLGNRSDAWLRLGARVVAVEPQPVCIEYLEKKFGPDPHFTLVPKAIGEHPCLMDLHISEKTPTITTLSGQAWQQAVQDVTSYTLSWDRTLEVEVITLDELIQLYGIPTFCKIDVEDFEVQVLRGLSQALPALSFEYFIPTIERTIECIHQLEALDSYRFNWSIGESQRFESERWLSGRGMMDIIASNSPSHQSGDVYARRILPSAS